MPGWVPRAIALFWLGFVALVAGRWLLGRLESLLVMLLVSLFLSFALEPAVNKLVRRGWRRGSATGAVLAALVVAIGGFTAVIGTLLVDQVANLIDKAPDYLTQIQGWVNRNFDANVEFDDVIDRLTQEGGTAQQWAQSLAGNTLKLSATALGIVLQAFSVGLFTFYLVAQGPRLRHLICSLLRPDRQAEVLRAWEVAIDKTGGYLYSRAILAAASALVHGVAFALIGVPHAVALAVWVGLVSQFLPVIGTYLAGVLPILVALVNRPVEALWVVIVIAVYQQVENYLLAPRVTARTMELNPALAFGSAIAGAAILGPVGAVLALPTAASVQAFAGLYLRRHEVIDSHLTAPPEPRRRRRIRRPPPPSAP
jgi:predicted PurR-regulated permease PerM